MVTGQMSAVHQNEKYFKNAKQFNPQRFLDDPASAEKVQFYAKQSDKELVKVIPFSLGKRQCLGESLARMELFMAFTTILQHYRRVFGIK